MDALRELFVQQLRGEIPPVRRVVIETTGLADPAPIIHTLLTDENLRERYRLSGVIVTVDAAHGLEQITAHEECLRQVVLADRLVVTKLDLCDAPPEALYMRLRDMNAGAPILDAASVSAVLRDPGGFDSTSRPEAAQRWLAQESDASHDTRHDPRVETFTLYRVRPLAWERFIAWLKPVLEEHGPRILRIKGILNVAGRDTPIVIQGVQHIFYPATTLPAWPDDDRRTKIVFITLGLEEAVLRPGFQALLAEETER